MKRKVENEQKCICRHLKEPETIISFKRVSSKWNYFSSKVRSLFSKKIF